MTRAKWKERIPLDLARRTPSRPLIRIDAEQLAGDLLVECAGHSPQQVRAFAGQLFDELFKAISVLEEAGYSRSDWPGFQSQPRPTPAQALDALDVLIAGGGIVVTRVPSTDEEFEQFAKLLGD